MALLHVRVQRSLHPRGPFAPTAPHTAAPPAAPDSIYAADAAEAAAAAAKASPGVLVLLRDPFVMMVALAARPAQHT